MPANQIQKHIKRIIQHDQLVFIPVIQELFNIRKSIETPYLIQKRKQTNKKVMIISVDTEKAFDKI